MSHSLYVGTRKGMFRVKGIAGQWHIADSWFLGDHVSMLLRDPRDGALYAAMNHGHFGAKLHRSRDDGQSWQELPAPAYPPKPEGVTDIDAWGRELEWKLRQIWALEPGDASQPGRLWCGTIPGGLFVSDDAGDSWRLVETLWNHPQRKDWMGGGADYPGIHSICVHPNDPRRVLLGVSTGGCWETLDDGQSWRVRSEGMYAEYMPPEKKFDPVAQDPHLVVQCRDQPDVLWAQHHNGIFRTTTGGERWGDVPNARPSTFGFAVVVHPRDGNTAWFVPAVKDEKRIPVGGQVVVSRTRDGGETFDVLTKGLPQEHAYDLVFRHCLALADDGHTLAFGSTTGSLWISTDAGDSWETISTHLPPIYCLKFG